ncbi:MAG: hypothetical protein KIT84_27390 [Labilithrix sp.]|nr:hypothetical protein [Labilithrix sp.]MCW5814782.1 hypothetical protein [Labilithrix sp.]
MIDLSPRPTVLVVEPDDLVRRVLVRRLATRCEVTPLANGASALQRLREQHFDVLLLDLAVGDMPSAEVARCALELDPELAIVVSATSTRTPSVPGSVAALAKPYDSAAVDRALDLALGARRRTA